MLNADEYQRVQQGDYVYHSSDGACCDLETVFEVEDRNRVTQYLRNVYSSVNIVGSDFSFRNPPHFNSVLEPEFSIADAEHETEALLQHLFYHPNTAPFLAIRIAQRLGISNPSPRYVREVAKGKKARELQLPFPLLLCGTMLLTPFLFLDIAFKSGRYVFLHEGITFGSGQYGDLAAMSAAILLDREHRSVSLPLDPFYGSLRVSAGKREPALSNICALTVSSPSKNSRTMCFPHFPGADPESFFFLTCNGV